MHQFPARKAAAFLLALTIAVPGCTAMPAQTATSSATQNPSARDAAAVSELRSTLSRMVKQKQIPGAIVRIVQNGESLADIRVGFQDVEDRTSISENTIFRLYSMSKPITSVAIMMLAEDGKLSLDDPASRFLPEFEDMRVYSGGTLEDMQTVPIARPITIRDLLTHTSGITYHFTGNTPVHQYYRKYGVMRDTPVGRNPGDGAPARSLDQLVERIGKAPLLYQPGEHFAYSYSTTVLGAIIERASGMRLDRFMRTRIFDPLDMRDTGFFVQGTALDRFIVNYLATADGLEAIEDRNNTDYKDPDRLLDGGGAIASTAEDYLHFAEMLANRGEFRGRRLLSARSVDAMFLPRTHVEGLGPEKTPFGYGFAIGDAQSAAAGMQPANTYGWSGSGNTYFFVDPDHDAVALLMTQVLVGADSQDRTMLLRKAVNKAAEALIH
ncbi:serine hydrolase domain-containing protein [Altericroceibacterium endophyticum]|uniref:Serine hydrolase n=1 Tax=Altericroceibacterium endophyticum TaxID=1808508 RepID=A0A6I4T6N9_9SPHN|nr:serine hydrolase domain-containing protein [Altericroceibacterium endophyticum]MXO66328.1 serine hydrolase [Altericroceibacterium endophyticum]